MHAEPDAGLNSICTHLGCVVPWNAAENKVRFIWAGRDRYLGGGGGRSGRLLSYPTATRCRLHALTLAQLFMLSTACKASLPGPCSSCAPATEASMTPR